ncbi:NAD(P)/FAD-dependent oxidoreductase [Pediococcus siamensis]|uniref:NAD(P)/FAD-dependent oxidoreductase n=1 Tax=Pediococcus siamensis TaxID=381829 RepID=UPI0039A334CF
MKKIAIIGGGIVGATAAYLLSKEPGYAVTLFDQETGQATKAAAGIISPWLSKRRNQKWYALASDGAHFIAQLAQETGMSPQTYLQSGTIVTRKDPQALDALEALAHERRQSVPMMGKIERLTRTQIKERMPLVTADLQGVFISGGARIDGQRFVADLLKLSQQNGSQIWHEKVMLKNDQTVQTTHQDLTFDVILLCAGAGVNELLAPLGYEVTVHPQKGQLIELKVPTYPEDQYAPVLMPEGEKDFMPIGNGRLIIGATHENEPEFDLEFTQEAFDELVASAQRMDANIHKSDLLATRVGTRAFTDDFSPFFGWLPENSHVLVASGLGSSGLTTGPLVAKLMTTMLTQQTSYANYQKDIETYLHKKE